MKPFLTTLLAVIITLPALAQTHQRVPDFSMNEDERVKPNIEILQTPGKAFTQVILKSHYKGRRMDTTSVFSMQYNAQGLPTVIKEYEYNAQNDRKEAFERILTNIGEGNSRAYTYDRQGNVVNIRL